VNTVTEAFIHKFKSGNLVDLKVKHGRWGGPYKLTVYKIDPPTKNAKPAAYMEIDIGEKELFKRWLIAGDQQIIRDHIPEEQKARVRVKRVN
jgi:hypothetical protein